ncbi:MAG: CRISPR-associated endonuclease Cas3'' [Candidatus Omnitrophota bacterium]
MNSACNLLLKKTASEVWFRGEQYAEAGKVAFIRSDEKYVGATVSGTQEYRVHLAFAGSGISKKCDCPYSRGSTSQHAACKHMVAVAVLWDEARGILRPSREAVKAETIPPPAVSRAQINALYATPLNADLQLLRIAVDERGRWSRPHSRLPDKPDFMLSPRAPLDRKEIRHAFSMMRSWTRRGAYDPYFCAGEMVAAFCEVLRVAKNRLASSSALSAAQVLREAQGFNRRLMTELIDDSDGLHAFTEAHLEDFYNEEFQSYIKSAVGLIDPDEDDYDNASEKKGKIEHSSAGAQIIYRALKEKEPEGVIVAQILSLCIASHHSGLIDCLTPNGQDNYHRRMKKLEEKAHTDEVLSCLSKERKEELENLVSSKVLINQLSQKVESLKEDNDSKETVMFKCGLLVRFLFSCLIDANRLSSADFELPGNVRFRNYGVYHPWSVLVERLDCKLKEFGEKDSKNDIDALRNAVSRQCLEFAGKPRGKIYQLTVPTGGGKTLASLRFAMSHAERHALERVFYVLPFTSIIDQNADGVGRDGRARGLKRVIEMRKIACKPAGITLK